MDLNKFIEYLRSEEEKAKIHGWDFSYIEGKYEEITDFSWDYKEAILRYLSPSMKILDMDTGGGEFLLSLSHPYENTAATENFEPNVKLCKETLLPLGIDFKKADAEGVLPFKNEKFDMVINRHGSFNENEIYRVLKKGGLFITQQVGADNERELVELLIPEAAEPKFPEQRLETAKGKFEKAGFEILESGEAFCPIRFFDVGALVWFAHIIEWEFPNFSVDKCLNELINAQRLLEKEGKIEGKTHRFFFVAKK